MCVLVHSVYVQILKQLVENPSPDSSSQGWKLLLALLERIPPGTALDPYIHMAIRQSRLPTAFKNRLRRSAHCAAYFKEEEIAALSASEAASVLTSVGAECCALSH
jgi:hypothetical protein